MNEEIFALPEEVNGPKQKATKQTVIKELQNNIDSQLEILQQRLNNEELIFLGDIDEILENTTSIIYECYNIPRFKPNLYKNFALLSFQYQRLSLRKEAVTVEEKIKELDKKAEVTRTKNEEIENSLKNWLGTIIGLFLTFTIIPTAITGITMINGNYILPFVATLILFGMGMIAYTYIINHMQITKKAYFILGVMLCLTIVLWYAACFTSIDISLLKQTILIE